MESQYAFCKVSFLFKQGRLKELPRLLDKDLYALPNDGCKVWHSVPSHSQSFLSETRRTMGLVAIGREFSAPTVWERMFLVIYILVTTEYSNEKHGGCPGTDMYKRCSSPWLIVIRGLLC
jgi:hypothetical protein